MDYSEGRVLKHRGLSPHLKPNVCLAGFQNYLGVVTRFFLSIVCFPFRSGMAITGILCLSHNCILREDNLFPSFTGPQMERNFAPGWIIHDLDD